MLSKFIQLVKQSQYHIFLSVCLGLIAFTSYNLGRINALEQTPIKVNENSKWKLESSKSQANIYSATKGPAYRTGSQETSDQEKPRKNLDTRVVASKSSSSKRYHYTWCSGAARIKEENKVWFNSAEEAESKGYSLAGNCLP